MTKVGNFYGTEGVCVHVFCVINIHALLNICMLTCDAGNRTRDVDSVYWRVFLLQALLNFVRN